MTLKGQIDWCRQTRYNLLLFSRIYSRPTGDISNRSIKPKLVPEKQGKMFDQISFSSVESLIAAARPSVWGIILVVIILVGLAAKVFANRRAVKVAMCQIIIIDGDRPGNFVRIENAITEAKSKGASLICFPEATMLGWVNPDAHTKARPIPGPDSDRLCELAKKYKTYLCVGLEEKDGDNLYDSALLIDDRGCIVLKHRKINVLPELMNPPYTPGTELAAADTRFGRIGLLICADTHRQDLLDNMRALQPALVLVPCGYAEQISKWPGHGRELQQAVTEAARRTGAAVVGTNSLGQITKGPWAGRVYGGQSVAVDKTGKILGIAKDRDRDIKIIFITAAG